MVQIYRTKSKRGSYSRQSMSHAVHAIKGGMCLYKATALFNISRTTLRRRLVSDCPGSLDRFKPVFRQEYEAELVMHAVEMQQRFYGISLVEFRRLAYEFADRNGLQHPFSKETRMHGKAKRDAARRLAKWKHLLSFLAPAGWGPV